MTLILHVVPGQIKVGRDVALIVQVLNSKAAWESSRPVLAGMSR